MAENELDRLLDDLVSDSSSSTPASSRPQSVISTGPGIRASTGPGPGFVSTGPGIRTSNGVSTGPGVRASTGPGPGFVSTGPGASRPGTVVSTGPGAGFVSTGPGTPGGSRPGSVMSTGPGPGFVSTGPGNVSTGPGANFVRPQPRGRGGGGIQGMATHTPDGRAIRVQTKTCDYCQDEIVGRITTAMGKNYHPEHFVCTNCSAPFPDGKYLAHDDKPYCETHYYELFAARCARCEQPIKEKLVRALEKNWHSEHFNCTGCGLNLVGKVYKEAAGDPYCKECKQALQIKIDARVHLCAECKRPIIGEYILLAGQYLHPEHFACAMCGKSLQHGEAYDFQGKKYCKEDYDKLRVDVCAGCRKPITGRSLNAMDRSWHPEHFCCSHCHEPLQASSYYEKNGMPYCEVHYVELFGSGCAYCGKQVVSGVEVSGKMYHKDCLMCTGCNISITSEKNGVCIAEGKPFCQKCYLKLPKDMRKRIEAKDRGERLADAKRQKELIADTKRRDAEAKKRQKEAMKGAKKNPHGDFNF